jgi:polyketide cyclase/dehydrase/lipid transport protein
MVVYEDDGIFAAPPDAVWALLQAHLDDGRVHSIHPLILTQRTISQSGPEVLVDRTIDVRGRSMRSTWKITYRPPDFARWDIVESEGPWASGSYLENRYSAAPGGTRIQTHGDLSISVLPFFLPQRFTIRRVFDRLEREDLAAIPR